jgi:germacradienol/geosmin synthase
VSRMPYRARVNPHLARSRRYALEWARAMGMLASIPGLWDERGLASQELAFLTARMRPDATGPELDLATAWVTWGTYGDDYVPHVFGSTRDVLVARAYVARLRLFMPLHCGATPPPSDPLERGLADLWHRTATAMQPGDRRTLREDIDTLTASWVWELHNRLQHRIPDPVDYVEMRRDTFGWSLMTGLTRVSRRGDLPPELFLATPLVELAHAAQDYCCLLNDILSYQKEIRFEGDIHNSVLVVQRFLNVDRARAVLVVGDLMASRLEQFEHILATELPLVADGFELDDDQRATLDSWVLSLQDAMAAMFEWHHRSSRYEEFEMRRENTIGAALGGPAGLGTAAAYFSCNRDVDERGMVSSSRES